MAGELGSDFSSLFFETTDTGAGLSGTGKKITDVRPGSGFPGMKGGKG